MSLGSAATPVFCEIRLLLWAECDRERALIKSGLFEMFIFASNPAAVSVGLKNTPDLVAGKQTDVGCMQVSGVGKDLVATPIISLY